jgi:hypothetical protein
MAMENCYFVKKKKFKGNEMKKLLGFELFQEQNLICADLRWKAAWST